MCSLWLSLDNPLTLYRTEMWRLWGKNGSIRAPFSLTVALTSLKALQVRQQSLQRSWASEWCLMRRYKFEAAADLSPEHLSLSLSLGLLSVFFCCFFFPGLCEVTFTVTDHSPNLATLNSDCQVIAIITRRSRPVKALGFSTCHTVSATESLFLRHQKTKRRVKEWETDQTSHLSQ